GLSRAASSDTMRGSSGFSWARVSRAVVRAQRAFFLSFAMARSLLGGFLLARITSTTRAVTGPTRAEVALRAITGPTTAARALTRVSSQSLNSAPWLVAE